MTPAIPLILKPVIIVSLFGYLLTFFAGKPIEPTSQLPSSLPTGIAPGEILPSGTQPLDYPGLGSPQNCTILMLYRCNKCL